MLRFIFVLSLFLLSPSLGLAAPASPLPTGGKASVVAKLEPVKEESPYTIRGVKVDVSAENSMKARDKAFMQGQKTAFETMAKNLSAEDTAKSIDDIQIGKLVKSFEVETERASGTRYTATLTYHFKPSETDTTLAISNASDQPKPNGFQARSATTMPPDRFLILPIMRSTDRNVLWEEKTSWHKAWDNVLSDHPMPDMILPEGTIEDVGTITANEALAGVNLPLMRMMRKYQASEIWVAALMGTSTTPQPSQTLSMQLSRYDGYGKTLGTTTLSVPANPNQTDMPWLQGHVSNAITAMRKGIQNMGGQPAAAPFPQQTGTLLRVTLTIPFATMNEWATKRDMLQSIPGMASVEILRMNRYRAIVQIDYTGAQAQLDQALSTRNMQILPTNPPDGTYILSSTGQPAAGGPPQLQPVFTTVYPPQIQQPQIQPVGEPQLISDQPLTEQP